MSNFNPIDPALYRVQAPQNVLDDDDDKERKRKKGDDDAYGEKQYTKAKKKAAAIVQACSLKHPLDAIIRNEQNPLKSHETQEFSKSKESQKACDILNCDCQKK